VDDTDAAGKGLAPQLLEQLYSAGLKIAPGKDFTEAGAKLMKKLEAAGVAIPAPMSVTDPWP